MSLERSYVEGHTAAILRTLTDDDVAIDGTSKTVTLILRDKNRGIVPISGNVAWSDAANGIVSYTPAAGDLRASSSPYRARWKVTDGSGAVAYYPEERDPGEEWKVWV